MAKIHGGISFRMFIGLLLAAGLLTPACQPCTSHKPNAKILVSTVPFTVPMMEARFIFLVDYLSKETGTKFEMLTGPSSVDAFQKMVKGEKVAFSFQNPYLYAILAEKNQAVPVMKTISLDGRTDFRGLVVAKEESPIRTVTDLRGKTVMATSRFNVGGFLAQWIMLKEAGLDPEKDLSYKFGEPQEKILEKVADGRAEIGFIREDVLEAMKNARGQMPRVKIIAATPYYPNHNIVSYPGTDSELVQKVKEALQKLDPQNPDQAFLLQRLRISGFAPTSASDYADFTNLLILNGFLTPPPNSAPVTETVVPEPAPVVIQ
ncbi:MAG: phosphate/phosphite/phosphonate ABC transporter substrate-binding protein [Proteobacteria bacterium]|nr:phosphate/phosphite/phosphonate ABC transporter substrate-binding protein [Pseudomonadota bacterium]